MSIVVVVLFVFRLIMRCVVCGVRLIFFWGWLGLFVV